MGGRRHVGGLVGSGHGAVIANSSAVSGSVNGTFDRVGGLVGGGNGATITQSYAISGSVVGERTVGGLIGRGWNAVIVTSFAISGLVAGDRTVGGLIGGGGETSITQSYAISGAVAAAGKANANSLVGGLIGDGRSATITQSYSVSYSVAGLRHVGGLVGYGGLVGITNDLASVTASYWDSDASGIRAGDYGEPQTSAALRVPTSATGIYETYYEAGAEASEAGECGWDFGSSFDYPVLRCLSVSPQRQLSHDADRDGVVNLFDLFPLDATESGDADGDGIGDNADPDDDNDGMEDRDTDGDGVGDNVDPDDDNDGLIELWNATMLYNVRYALDGSGYRESAAGTIRRSGCGGIKCVGYELMTDISLASYADYDGGKGWPPIGRDTDPNKSDCQGKAFSAIFEGNNRTVRDLTIARPNEECVGLFGLTANAHIRNLHLRASSITGRVHVGGLVGSGWRAEIAHSSVWVNGNVSGSNGAVGGLVGWGQYAEIAHSSARVSGSVSGAASNVGGLIGAGQRAEIAHSSVWVNGRVNGIYNVGGLVGHGLGAVITRSSARVSGNVRGTSHVGGLVGFGDNADIAHSSALSGAVTVSGGRVGGLVGTVAGNSYINSQIEQEGSATITNVTALSGLVAGRDYVGGLIGDGESAVITNATAATASVNGTGDRVGGLVGDGGDASITNSYAVAGSVTGDDRVGGLVGSGDDADIMNSYAISGAIAGDDDDVGGLVGFGRDAAVTHSFALSGAVTGDQNVGGLVGQGDGGTGITASYWDSDTGNITAGSYGEPQTSDALRMPVSAAGIYADWDDGDCGWHFGDSMQYPALLCLPVSREAQRSLYSVSGGEVSIRLPE